jgi:hypothetical protein
MAPESRHIPFRILAFLLAALSLSACSSVSVGPGGKITKVNYYHLNSGRAVTSIDPAVTFERDYRLFGAVTKAEIQDRTGHYYTIYWSADDRTQPVTVRFEYRQANSGLEARVVEEEVSDLRRTNVSRFQVVGDEYTGNGRVTSWRVSILRGREELASQESYLWN